MRLSTKNVVKEIALHFGFSTFFYAKMLYSFFYKQSICKFSLQFSNRFLFGMNRWFQFFLNFYKWQAFLAINELFLALILTYDWIINNMSLTKLNEPLVFFIILIFIFSMHRIKWLCTCLRIANEIDNQHDFKMEMLSFKIDTINVA